MAELRQQRRLAAILSADVVGFSRLMEADENGTLANLKRHRAELIDPKIAQYGGRVVSTAGDSLLCEFTSVVDAVQCAVEVQAAMHERNLDASAGTRMDFRIGVNVGDVIADGGDIFGDGVNVAARLQALAEPEGVCISGTVHEQVSRNLPYAFRDLGEKSAKNIARPIRVYAVETSKDTHAALEPTRDLHNLAPPDKPSIAALPFVNMSGDPEQEFFSDGITEDIITALSRFRSLMVIARNSSFHYKGQSPKIQDVGAALGVTHVLEGSVRRAGNRARITAQLVESVTGNHVWAHRYDRDLDDIFAVQDDVVRAIVSALTVNLAESNYMRAERKPTGNLTAYDLLLRGRRILHRTTPDSCAEARRCFESAIVLDPRYGEAFSHLAWTYLFEYELGWSSDPHAAFARAHEAAQRAVELDRSDAWAFTALAYVCVYGREFDRGMSHIERALELNPNDADSLSMKSLFLSFIGRPDAAIEPAELALRLNPIAPEWYHWNRGIALISRERYADALSAFREISAPVAEILGVTAVCRARLGAVDEARETMNAYLRRASEEMPNYPGDDGAAWRQFWLRSFPYKDAEDSERLLEGLRLAGLPVATGGVSQESARKSD